MTADLEKILETMERQNEIIASLTAENEKFTQTIKELREQVATERSHKLAYQRRLRELEPPPNERQEEQGYTYEQKEFWDSLNDLSETKQYERLKGFLSELEQLYQEEYIKLSEEKRQQYKKEYNEIKREIQQLESEKPKFFGLVADKDKEQRIRQLKSKQGIAKLHFDSYNKDNQALRKKAESNVQESIRSKGLTDIYTKTNHARAFVAEYEQAKAKTW